jgi:flagellar motor switch protein FliN/FliY
VGDVLVLPRFPLANDGGQLLGRVALVPSTSERGLTAELGRDLAGREQLVIRTERVESHAWDHEEQRMPEAGAGSDMATIEVLDDVSLVVRVELGAVEMKAGEWASLGDGDVIALGRKLGDPAILRIGGVEVARGELVQIDGEYGVRILRRGEA